MITVPVVAGLWLAGPRWVHVPLVLLWWAGYFLFYAAALWLRSGRRARYAPPVRAYGAVVAVLGVAVVVVTPHLVRWLPVYLPLVATTAWASTRRRDRSLLNDTVTVLAACLMTAVVYDAPLSLGTSWTATGLPGASPDSALTGWPWAWLVAALLLAYFWGTVPYVKTLIRERGNPVYRRLSVGYHAVVAAGVVALAVGGLVAGAHAAVWVLLAVRAWAMPRWQDRRGRPLRPVVIGVGEVVASVAVLLTLLA